MTAEVVIEAYDVQRPRPLNLKDEDDHLFTKEWQRDFDEVRVMKVEKAWVDSAGMVATSSFRIVPSSLINQRRSPSDIFARAKAGVRLLLKASVRTSKQYVWISERWSSGYFHWFCDALPRYFALKARLAGHTILLPEEYEGYNYVIESLSILDLPHAFIKRRTRQSCKEIFYCDLLAPPGNFYPPIINAIREELRSRVEARKTPLRVFVSRQEAHIRKILNITDCQPILEEFGFEIVVMEDHPLQEQFEQLSGAEIIMGVHGAGLTNMLVCPDSCIVVEIRGSQDIHNNCFFSMAAALNLDYYYLLAKENPTSTDQVGNVTLDATLLRSFLSENFPLVNESA